MRGRWQSWINWKVLCIASIAAAAGLVGCGISVAEGDSATGNPNHDAADHDTPDHDNSMPESTLPLTQTPEYLASNTPCPPDLPELGARPLSETAPGRSVTLAPFLELPGATVMAFASAASPADSPSGFVGDREGRIWHFASDASGAGGGGDGATSAVLLGDLVADFSSNTAAEHDQGLVGMTFGPLGRLWINRTDRHGTSLLTVLTPGPDGTTLEGATADLLRLDQPSAQHNGGDLVFDADDLLYVSFGDGGGLGDPRHHGQDLATPLGAVLRFEVMTGNSDSTDDWQLEAASDNPDLGPGADPRIWAYGVRNPFRMSLDAQTGDWWIADVGQQCVEEVTVLGTHEAGANLGWSAWEGSRRFVGPHIDSHRAPDLEYRHGRGLCAIVGGHVYRGARMEWLRGRYVFADLCGGDIYAAAVGAGAEPDDVWNLGVSTSRPVGFALDAGGELYVIDIESGVYRLDS